MTTDIAIRYAQALFEAATEARATAETLEQLAAIGAWLRRHPELLGGLQVRLDHRVIDGSVRRQLIELRERLTTARVN